MSEAPDIIAVPPDAMRGAMNIADEVGWIMTIDAGHAVAASETPGESLRR